jgi:hypothetical protein
LEIPEAGKPMEVENGSTWRIFEIPEAGNGAFTCLKPSHVFRLEILEAGKPREEGNLEGSLYGTFTCAKIQSIFEETE